MLVGERLTRRDFELSDEATTRRTHRLTALWPRKCPRSVNGCNEEADTSGSVYAPLIWENVCSVCDRVRGGGCGCVLVAVSTRSNRKCRTHSKKTKHKLGGAKHINRKTCYDTHNEVIIFKSRPTKMKQTKNAPHRRQRPNG